ncbi:MAG: hypothetical protein IJE10_06000 [Clostridia bacterium]|nr:hypothetical protein [Clostridia bacterium]
MKKIFSLFLAILLLLPCFISLQAQATQTEYVVRYDNASVTYTGTWQASSQYSDATTASSKMTSNKTGTATFPLPSGAPAGEYAVYYFLAHTTTTGMTVTVNDINTHFSATVYGYPTGAVNQYIRLGGDTTFTMKGDGTDKVVLTGSSASYARATSVKFVYMGQTKETHKVLYNDSSVTYTGTWTTANQYADETTATSSMTSTANSTAFFPLPQNATAGSYAIYYYLTHTTSGYTASIGSNSYTLTPSSYGYTTTATAVRNWIRVGGADAVFDLKPGDGITLTRNGYTRATAVKFVRIGNTDTNYLTLPFDSDAELSDISANQGELSVANGCLSFTHTGSTQSNITFPALKNTPATGDVVLDFTTNIAQMSNKMVFLVRAGNANKLFMHSELYQTADGIQLQYYNGSSTATVSDSGYYFIPGTNYRFVIVFHTGSATYDIKVYDLDNQYLVESISGIAPKASEVTADSAIKSFEMQNHNASQQAAVSGWSMSEFYMYDSEKLSLPSYPAPPVVLKTFERIALANKGFSKSGNWETAKMPDSAGTESSLYTTLKGEYAMYTPSKLTPGWYKVSFWNIKYQSNQNPMKMNASVYSDGRLHQNLPLPVNTESEDRGGIWSEIGTFYFNGDNTEYVSLVATGGSYARVADVKFELQENYTPDYTLIADKTSVALQSNLKLDSPGGIYTFYTDGITNGTMRILRNKEELAVNRIVSDGQKNKIGTFVLPENEFITMQFNGNLNNGKLYFEEATNKKHAIIRLSDNLMNGEQVFCLSAGDFNIEADVLNPDNPSGTATLFVALFDGKTLKDISASDCAPLTNGKATLSTDLSIKQITDNSYLKIMIWDSVSGMHPLTEASFVYPYSAVSPYLVLATDFTEIGSWSLGLPNDDSAFSASVLSGLTTDGETRPATYTLNCSEPGTYKLWVRGRNFADTAGKRHFKVAVNGTESEAVFGSVVEDGYIWEDGGTVTLNEGENILSVIDSSCYYARLDAILLTKDLSHVPSESYEELTTYANKVQNLPTQFTEADFMRDVTIDENFSGGNILVDGMKQNVIYVRPDLSDTSTDWFYWNFKATSETDRTVTFKFKGTPYIISASGVAYSYDDETWNYLSESAYKTEFTFDLKAGETVHFACAIPYVYSDLTAFLDTCETDYSQAVTVSTLCLSEQERVVPMLTLGNTESEECVVMTSRHHCCETTPSFLLEGLVDYLATEASTDLLDKYCFYIVPMMDVDGVENGDQGKLRIPHDHNRDYDEQIYNSVKSLVSFVEDKNVVAFMDFHCPGLQTPDPYFYYDSTKDESPLASFREALLQTIAEDTTPDKIEYLGNTDYDDAYFTSCSRGYFFLKKSAPLATTLEFPYTGRVGNEYTPARMHHFGENVGKAFETYLLNK